MIGRTNVGGGGGIAVSVTNYSSAEALPSTAKENTIAVITDTAITGYVFSDVQPSSLAVGFVWFNVNGGEVSIGMDRKRIVTLNPNNVNQWDGGSFAKREAHVFQNGKWVNFASASLFIYNNGTEYFNLVAVGKKQDASHSYAVAPTINKYTGNIVIAEKAGAYNAGIAYFDPPIDLSDYKKICVSYSVGNYDPSGSMEVIKLRAYTAIGNYHDDNSAASLLLPSAGGEAELDVSSLNGNHYIAFSMIHHPNAAGSGNLELTLSALWLE